MIGCKITIKLFGVSKDLLKDTQISMSLSKNISVRELRLKILEKYPLLNSINNGFVLSVNHVIVNNETVISSDDEVALLPPVSGG